MVEVVAAILINKEDKILIAKRKKNKKMGGLWEFPGGKIEQGETPENALIRELKEEMNIGIRPITFFGENIYDYGNSIFKLIAYISEIVQGEIELNDHEEYKWVCKEELGAYKFAPADVVFVEKLKVTGKGLRVN